MSEKMPRFLLNHIVKCGILTPDNSDEICSMFPDDVNSTMAVSAISSIPSNGLPPNMDSQFKIDWTFQLISYCLTLPSIFPDSISKSISILNHWANDDNLFPDRSMRNKYLRKIFRVLSVIYDFSFDKNCSPHERVELIQVVLQNIEQTQQNLSDVFEEETWTELIQVLIGCSDYLTEDTTNTYLDEVDQKKLLVDSLNVTFTVLTKSKLRSPELWQIFAQYCKKWSINHNFLKPWKAKILSLYGQMLLFISSPDEEFKELNGFHLNEFIRAIDLGSILQDSNLFGILADLVNKLYLSTKSFCDKTPTLHIPRFPLDLFFGLFGNWCFKPFALTPYMLGHSVLLETFIDATNSFYLQSGSPWIPLVMSTIKTASQSEDANIQVSLLKTGYKFIQAFDYDSIINMFFDVAKTYLNQDIQQNDSFWVPFTYLLFEVSQRVKIPKELYNTCFKKSTTYDSRFSLLAIAMKSNYSVFMQMALALYNNVSEQNIKFLTYLNLFFAANFPFYGQNENKQFISKILNAAKSNIEDMNYLTSFFIVISQLSRYTDEIYNNEIASQILDFIFDLYRDKGDYYKDALHLDTITSLICGRSQSIHKKSKRIVSFMIADQAIFSLLEDETELGSFIIELRDSRGYFTWKLLDNKHFTDWTPIAQDYILSPPAEVSRPMRISGIHTSSYDHLEEFIEKIKEEDQCDPSFLIPSNHQDKSYLNVHFNQETDLRHKCVDFILETGLFTDVKQIIGNADEVISKYDSIDNIRVQNIPVYHFSQDGLVNESTPLYLFFMSTLGTNCPETQSYSTNLGILTISYKDTDDDDCFIKIIFNESSLDLNLAHKSIPRAKLLIIVDAYNERYFKVECKCRNPNFWCSVLRRRLVIIDNLSAIISSIIFEFIALNRSEILFSKNEERTRFLQSIETKRVSLLQLVDGYSFDAIKSQAEAAL